MDIEREWSKHPGWFATLDPEQQALLIAERRIKAKEAQEARKQAEAKARAAKGRMRR